MWFIGVEVEQGTSAPPPKKNTGSAPELNTHEALLCLTQSILVTRAQPHIPEICLSTLSVTQ